MWLKERILERVNDGRKTGEEAQGKEANRKKKGPVATLRRCLKKNREKKEKLHLTESGAASAARGEREEESNLIRWDR